MPRIEEQWRRERDEAREEVRVLTLMREELLSDIARLEGQVDRLQVELVQARAEILLRDETIARLDEVLNAVAPGSEKE